MYGIGSGRDGAVSKVPGISGAIAAQIGEVEQEGIASKYKIGSWKSTIGNYRLAARVATTWIGRDQAYRVGSAGSIAMYRILHVGGVAIAEVPSPGSCI